VDVFEVADVGNKKGRAENDSIKNSPKYTLFIVRITRQKVVREGRKQAMSILRSIGRV